MARESRSVGRRARPDEKPADHAEQADRQRSATNHEPRTTNHALAGRLFVVATPIGNLEDLSARARRILAEADCVLAEDTRRIRKLLNQFMIRTPAHAFHDHNEAREMPRLLARLRAGAQLALVSDAGTPLLADPGYRLVRACRAAGVPVLAVPGASAITAALAVAGLPPYPFTFAGFLPAGAAARQRLLDQLAALPHTLVLFLSPHRLAGELAACAERLGGGREAALLAELTKLHERCITGALAELVASGEGERPRGEYTLIVGPPAAALVAPATRESARIALAAALEAGHALAEARRAAARSLGITRKQLYRLLSEEGNEER
ncbi:MAG: 16S rRNA (cytidine(1402)-2'-O)-methyltransferase [Acidobacteriota bacterium]